MGLYGARQSCILMETVRDFFDWLIMRSWSSEPPKGMLIINFGATFLVCSALLANLASLAAFIFLIRDANGLLNRMTEGAILWARHSERTSWWSAGAAPRACCLEFTEWSLVEHPGAFWDRTSFESAVFWPLVMCLEDALAGTCLAALEQMILEVLAVTGSGITRIWVFISLSWWEFAVVCVFNY